MSGCSVKEAQDQYDHRYDHAGISAPDRAKGPHPLKAMRMILVEISEKNRSARIQQT
jgi:hypothetical protein